MKEHFISGSWWVRCDRCGFKRRAADTVETWDNLRVCSPKVKAGCFETKHPQMFVRVSVDDQSVPFIRTNVDIDDNGQPTLSQSAAINCNAFEARRYDSPITASVTIMKGTVMGPLQITAGTTTVVCSLEII